MDKWESIKKRAEWCKHFPLEAAELIEQQKKEFITFSQAIAEDDGIIEQLQEELKKCKFHESLLLERIKKQTLEIKEMKNNSRLTRFYVMAEENLKLAEENARLKDDKDLFSTLFIKQQLGEKS
jgi:hypothetical protein